MPLGQQQRVSRLQFMLYDRPVHPEFFDIYHDHHVVKRGYEAQIWITGTSHAIGFYCGDSTLMELIADSAAVLPRRGRLASIPCRGEKEHRLVTPEGIRYMMCFQVETLSPRVYAKIHNDLAAEGTQEGLFVPFPHWTRNSLVPFTYIDYEAMVRRLHVFAYHAFPDELTLIKSQTIFEIL